MVCIGDSGGALMCHGFLFGITSHGYNYYPGMAHLKTECGDSRVQTRHIFIYAYRNWIDDIMHGKSSKLKFNHLMFVLFSIVRFIVPIYK
jgi:secreted trypsin-like serine protease